MGAPIPAVARLVASKACVPDSSICMRIARNAQANFTTETQRTQRREINYVFFDLLAFGGCSP